MAMHNVSIHRMDNNTQQASVSSRTVTSALKQLHVFLIQETCTAILMLLYSHYLPVLIHAGVCTAIESIAATLMFPSRTARSSRQAAGVEPWADALIYARKRRVAPAVPNHSTTETAWQTACGEQCVEQPRSFAVAPSLVHALWSALIASSRATAPACPACMNRRTTTAQSTCTNAANQQRTTRVQYCATTYHHTHT